MTQQSYASQVGAYHLADNPALYEPQRNNNFEFIVTNIDGIIGVGDGKRIANAQEVLRFSTQSATIPFFTQEPITIRRGNSVMKAAGLPSFQAGRLTINDYIGADSKSVLMAWQNLSYNARTERVGKMIDYKKDCYLIEYSPSYEMVRQWVLKGCWISALSEDDFNMDDGGKKVITATIEFDKAFMQLPDFE